MEPIKTSAPNHPILHISDEKSLEWYIDQYNRVSTMLANNASHDEEPDLCYGCGCCIQPLDVRAHDVIQELERYWQRIVEILHWVPEPHRNRLRTTIYKHAQRLPKRKATSDYIVHGIVPKHLEGRD